MVDLLNQLAAYAGLANKIETALQRAVAECDSAVKEADKKAEESKRAAAFGRSTQ